MNYEFKAIIMNRQCVALVPIPKPHHSATVLRALYESIISDMKSLAALKHSTTGYGDINVPILLEKLPEKLLADVLKDYPNKIPSSINSQV